MYKIIGADKKVYGPVTLEQIRQWVAENRVNGRTEVQLEGSQEWKPLSAFPEFANLPASNPPIGSSMDPASGMDARAAALQAVKGPAIGLKVTAILGLIGVGLGLIVNVLSLAGVRIIPTQQMEDPNLQLLLGRLGGALGIVQGIIGAIVAFIILNGASKMQALQKHQFAFAVSIIAMLPCVSPCCLLGLPFGIWALVVLNRPEIKSQFD